MKISKDDIFLVSFPKSGNTWLRFLLGNYISNNKINYLNIDHWIPEIHQEYEKNKEGLPFKFIKSHFIWHESYNENKTIYLMRDGKDVAVSYYFHLISRNVIDPAECFENYFINRFLLGHKRFGNWFDHVSHFWSLRKQSNIHILKYEDLKKNTVAAFSEILNFTKIKIDSERLDRAIAQSDFKNMSKDEDIHRTEISRKYKLDENGPKQVRKGISGDWENYFTEELLAKFNNINSLLLKELGYYESKI